MEHAVQQEYPVERVLLEGNSSLLQVGDSWSILGLKIRPAGHTHLSDTQEDAYSCAFLIHIPFLKKNKFLLISRHILCQQFLSLFLKIYAGALYTNLHTLLISDIFTSLSVLHDSTRYRV